LPAKSAIAPGTITITGATTASGKVGCSSGGVDVRSTTITNTGKFTEVPQGDPAQLDSITFVSRVGGTATITTPKFKSADVSVSGTVTSRSEAAGAVNVGITIARDNFDVIYRCPGLVGSYAVVLPPDPKGWPRFDIGFTVSAGGASIRRVVVFSSIMATTDFPLQVAQAAGAYPLDRSSSFSLDAPVTSTAFDGAAGAGGTVHVMGHLDGEGGATGRMSMLGPDGATTITEPWTAENDGFELSTPVITARPPSAISSDAARTALAPLLSVIYPGAMGAVLEGQRPIVGGPVAPPVYVFSHIGVRTAALPRWGIDANATDSATLTYGVVADAASIMAWYLPRMTALGWHVDDRTRLDPWSSTGGTTPLWLDVTKNDLEASVSVIPLAGLICSSAQLATCPVAVRMTVKDGVHGLKLLSAPVGVPPVCPAAVGGAQIKLAGVVAGTSSSTCLGFWNLAPANGASCSGPLSIFFLINGIPIHLIDDLSGFILVPFDLGYGEAFAWQPNPSRGGLSIDRGTVTIHAQLNRVGYASAEETISASVPCQGTTPLN
jgi:hypothetical protein